MNYDQINAWQNRDYVPTMLDSHLYIDQKATMMSTMILMIMFVMNQEEAENFTDMVFSVNANSEFS